MQAVINVDSVRVVDVPDRAQDGTLLGTKTRKVAFNYTCNSMVKSLLVDHPATVDDMKNAVAACIAMCNSIDQQTNDYKQMLSGNATVDL